jgi:hypothetical protein
LGVRAVRARRMCDDTHGSRPCTFDLFLCCDSHSFLLVFLFMKLSSKVVFARTSCFHTSIFQNRMASTSVRQQPPWTIPQGTNTLHPKLKIYNSLTRSKTPFVPIDQEGKRITWYACGPTVYDDAHLGHARNYVTTDIIRRLLRDYFRFDVRFIMNITDIDDKVRSRSSSVLNSS